MQISSSKGLGSASPGGIEKYVNSKGEEEMKEVPVDRIGEDVSEMIKTAFQVPSKVYFLKPVTEFVFSFSVLGLIFLLDPSVSFFFPPHFLHL